MTALACIRVFIGADLGDDRLDSLAPLVARVGNAFLEGKWQWPRKHAVVAPFAFALSDPRVERLDSEDLRALSSELQQKLFGDKGAGEVCLLMLEGDTAEIQRFAAADREALSTLLQGGDAGIGGRLSEIRPEGVRVLLPDHERDDDPAPIDRALRLGPKSPQPRPPAWRGVYNTIRKAFVGSVIDNRQRLGVQGEMEAQISDIEGLLTIGRTLRSFKAGVLFCPISYNCLIRPSLRDNYLPVLDGLAPADRPRLAVTVYDVPRQTNFMAVRRIKALTTPYFSLTDFQITDPEFDIGLLPRDTANSVTYSLPNADRRNRIRAIDTFVAKSADYRRAGIWQGLADVVDRAELLHACARAMPFVSGPAVTDQLLTPLGGRGVSLDDLPYRNPGFRRPRRTVKVA